MPQNPCYMLYALSFYTDSRSIKIECTYFAYIKLLSIYLEMQYLWLHFINLSKQISRLSSTKGLTQACIHETHEATQVSVTVDD